MKQNCVIDNSLPPNNKEKLAIDIFVIDNKKSFMKYPPPPRSLLQLTTIASWSDIHSSL